ncbi:unnamed protein product [Leptosia nina]|uniref:NADH dehydrogenase [ubiquinone] 1 alpha subcomplex subunit 12 n=1 Tax=Leptosia nina TaxID=320188 RepID=A0AAV1K2K9_9NEOP
MVFQYLALDKWFRLIRIISQNGGPFGSIIKLWRTDTLKEGKLIGTDAFGNKYYENTLYMICRSRWVEYNPNVKWDYDASQVTAEWFGWLHYKTDRLPSQDCAKYCLMSSPWTRCWLLPHEENQTGTDKAYYPYQTTKAHIVVWDAEFRKKRKIRFFFARRVVGGNGRGQTHLPTATADETTVCRRPRRIADGYVSRVSAAVFVGQRPIRSKIENGKIDPQMGVYEERGAMHWQQSERYLSSAYETGAELSPVAPAASPGSPRDCTSCHKREPPDEPPPPPAEDACAGCGARITDRYYLLALERRWHTPCLRCCECKMPLDSEQRCYARDSNIFCKNDYLR